MRTELENGIGLAENEASEQPGAVSAEPADGGYVFPVSSAQQRLWFLDRFRPGDTAYLIPWSLRLSGPLDAAALERSLDEIVRRHEVLRTTFDLEDGEPVQVIRPHARLRMPVVNLTAFRDPVAEARRMAVDEGALAIDLQRGPMVRARLLRLGTDDHVLLFTMHHIAFDGSSRGVFARELKALYEDYSTGKESPLPEPALQYADFTVWQREQLGGDKLGRQLDYWKTTLEGISGSLDLPTDRPRPAVLSDKGGARFFRINAGLKRELTLLARRSGATLYMTLLAAFQALLSRYSGQSDVVVGSPIAGRNRRELEDLIGLFANTIVLRSSLEGNPSFTELIARTRETCLGAFANQDVPFEKLVESLPVDRNPGQNPVFQVVFALQNVPATAFQLHGLKIEPFRPSETAAKFDISLLLSESPEIIQGRIEYHADLFDEATIERMVGHYLNLLEGIVRTPGCPVLELPLFAPEEGRFLAEWNNTARDYPRNLCVHQIFERQCADEPDRVAVSMDAESFTYEQLNARANQVAHWLRLQGARQGTFVGIRMSRSRNMVAGLLGILKSGAAYVPVDPAFPPERIALMLEDAQARIVLDDTNWDRFDNLPTENPSASAGPEDIAYVLHTSGSTGRPKGVEITHRNLVNFLCGMREEPGISPEDTLLAVTTLSFDIAGLEIYLPLVAGAKILLASRDETRDGARLLNLIRGHRPTLLQATPATWRMLLEAGWEGSPNLKALCGGEALPPDLARQLLPRCRELWNMYGPTETTIWSSVARIRSGPGSAAPLGRPIINTTMYVLDERRQLAPLGVPGELYIGGDGVARGYLNRPDLTAERFVDDPFSPGERLYRTGDLVKLTANGELQFVGRVDHQVKIRGFRIELGEIESRLLEHPQVRKAVVIAREDSRGEKRLVAYYVPAQEADDLSLDHLRSHISDALPEYMLPAAFVKLQSLPLTPNGKLDRKALPAPEADAYSTQGYEAPEGEIEIRLAEIWAAVLGLDRVGRNDNFFELGGHSLLAVTLLARMRSLGIDTDVRTLFSAPTVSALASAIGSKEPASVVVPPNGIPSGCDDIRPDMLPLVQLTPDQIQKVVDSVPGGAANIQDLYPLVSLQAGILFHHLSAQEGDPYLIASQISFDNRQRLDRYVAALQTVIHRHDVLRTAILWEGVPEPVQVVWRTAPVRVELAECDASKGDISAQMYARYSPRHFRINLDQAPLIRLFVAHDAENDRWLMMQLLHHMAGDHSTLDILYGEIKAILLGKADRLPRPVPFRNMVGQARFGVRHEEHEAFFRQMLGGVDEPTAPFGLLDVHGDGTRIEEARLDLATALADRLRTQARRLGVTVATLCHVGWAQVLSRVSGREDVVFGTVLFGRMHGGEGADRAMGLFMNTVPVRIRAGEEGVESVVRRTHSLLGELMRHEHASLALAQRCSAVPAGTPLFSALLNYRHTPGVNKARSEDTIKAWDGIQVLRGEERTNYPLVLSINDSGESFSFKAQTAAPLEPMRVCELMRVALESLAEALEVSPQRAVWSLDVLPASERDRLLHGWNKSQTSYPSHQCAHQLFEQQVAKSPDSIALICGEEQLTYAQLNARANQVAHRLRALGAGSESLIGICLDRSPDMVVAILAALKCGGAYLPLDPVYPPERRAFMLEDARVAILITESRLRLENPVEAHTIVLDEDRPALAREPVSNLEPLSTPENAAYVIYTSGSTGRPKGVVITHANIVRLFTATDHWFGFGPNDTWTLFHSFAFDFSVWEIWGALLYGGKLVVVPWMTSRSPELFHELLVEHKVTVLNQTPSAFRNLIAADERSPRSGEIALRYVIFGGEALEFASLLPWIERHGDRPALVNMYGITETTVHVTYYRIPTVEVDRDTPSLIGVPIPDLQAYVLDDHLRLVPEGVTGQLFIGGAGLAREYLNRPELTADRFLPNPFDVSGRTRLYRTGDLARYYAGGNLQYLGRCDQQVKIRGFRIELGEIETRLSEHPSVAQCAVLARGQTANDTHLAAYVVLNSGQTLMASEMREFIRRQLPDYMTPTSLICLSTLPLTTNGKVDRKLLQQMESRPQTSTKNEALFKAWREELESLLLTHPDIEEAVAAVRDVPGSGWHLFAWAAKKKGSLLAGADLWNRVASGRVSDIPVPAILIVDRLPRLENGEIDIDSLSAPLQVSVGGRSLRIEPRNALECQLVRVWEEVLGVSPVSINDNYFELGGHSITAIRLFHRIEEETGRQLPLSLLFKAPTIAEFAAAMREQAVEAKSETLLVPCRATGSKPPLFAIHGLGGNILAFWDLARHLGSDRPVYCMETLDPGTSERSLEEVAARYIRDIRAFRPEGPYHLTGSSFGGMLIFEMARQLRASGVEVGLVGLLDTHNMVQSARLSKSIKMNRARVLRHLNKLPSKRLREWPRYLAGRVVAIGRRVEHIAWRHAYRSYVSLAGRKKTANSATEPGGSKPSPFQDLWRVYQAMGLAYKPSPYTGNVVLFRATDPSRDGSYGPWDLGWTPLTAGGLEIVKIPGDHLSMLHEPNIAALAEEMTRWLSRYERGRCGTATAGD